MMHSARTRRTALFAGSLGLALTMTACGGGGDDDASGGGDLPATSGTLIWSPTTFSSNSAGWEITY